LGDMAGASAANAEAPKQSPITVTISETAFLRRFISFPFPSPFPAVRTSESPSFCPVRATRDDY